MKFGIFDHLDRRQAPIGEIYQSRLDLVARYDAAGFHAYHLAEHHATPLGLAPAPGIFLAAVAERTKRLRFGPLVYTLPLYNPLRLIEEICMLDQLSGGRLELGVGRGIVPYEVAYFGLSHLETPAMHEEALSVILKGLTSPVLDHQGIHYKFRKVPMILEPVQRPHPPLWYGVSNPASVPWAAANNVSIVSNGPCEATRATFDRYRELRRGEGPYPFLGLSRHITLAETDGEADAIAAPNYLAWFDNLARLWRDFGAEPVRFAKTYAEAKARGVAIAGTPASVRAEIARQIEASGCNYFICRFAYGELTHEQALRSLDLFTRDVMPHFRRDVPSTN
jgi:alkanesulfonate monooxygenase SsuD/methylene tetrahydromethanopterin reductase-like flavin-dependent oxidoreductase (luciferase family)